MGLIRSLFTGRAPQLARVFTPPGTVPRDRTSLLQKRGWTSTSRNSFTGHFATKHGTWPGRIERAGDVFRVLIHDPPTEVVAKHPKWSCFSKQHDGWWNINIRTQPIDRDPNAVCFYVEQLLAEAFALVGKA